MAAPKRSPWFWFFSIAMGANYSFELISVVHWVPQFFMHNKSILGGVRSHVQLWSFLVIYLYDKPGKKLENATKCKYELIKILVPSRLHPIEFAIWFTTSIIFEKFILENVYEIERYIIILIDASIIYRRGQIVSRKSADFSFQSKSHDFMIQILLKFWADIPTLTVFSDRKWGDLRLQI